MDLMKVFDQAVREIKREVNLKVLKVPEIEQKVLDATNDEPWGPHGSALSELAQATKKFKECQLIMSVLWTRLIDTGPNWCHVYKALTVIEYLIANGSERAVDDILEHSFQISAISGFEYVEPNGKDVGINVRKKVETILALLNDRDKIKTIREKAASNRDKYVGLSSTGMSYRSSAASYGSGNFSSNFQNSDRYGSLSGSREGDSFRESYKEGEQYRKENKLKYDSKDDENKGSKVKKQMGSKPGIIPPSKTPNVQADIEEDDFDFDPRGSSSAGSSHGKSSQVDLFGQSLMDDLIDTAPTTLLERTPDHSNNTPEVDLFADATFQSASPAEAILDSHAKGNVDLFSSQPAIHSFPSSVDFFAVPDAGLPSESKSTKMVNAESFDPFASIPLDNFGGSDDPFGTFASNAKSTNIEPSKNSMGTSTNNLDEDTTFGEFSSHTEQNVPESSKHSSTINLDNVTSAPATKKDNFQVKSDIWADCLNRGLIDLTISAPNKVNSADIGIVRGLEDAFAEKEKGAPTTTFIGRTMGAGSSGTAWPGLSSSTEGSGSFANFGQNHFGNFK